MLPIKGEYSKHDFARMARFHKVPFRLPEKFPVGTQVAARAFYLIADGDAARRAISRSVSTAPTSRRAATWPIRPW